MKQHIACCPFLMAGACLLSVVQSVHAQTANDILNKATAVYANAKTYQASFDKEEDDLHEDKTTDSHETETVHVKAIGTTKFTLDNLKSHRFDDSSVDDWHIFDNGKDHYIYMPHRGTVIQGTRTTTGCQSQRPMECWT